MTRGQIAIITDERIITSIEFNGDMYIENGHGTDVLRKLCNVNDISTYERMVEKFNKTHHNYDADVLTYTIACKDSGLQNIMNMSEGYFDKWFSDYIYIKNLTDNSFHWIDRDGYPQKIQPSEIAVINIGRLIKTDAHKKCSETLPDFINELCAEDKAYLQMKNVINKVRGLYEDAYDVGRDYIDNNNVPEWIKKYIDFEVVGTDLTAADTFAWITLPSGEIAHLE